MQILISWQSARFLTFDRRITECWSQLGAAVRTAQALGFHRDGASMVRDVDSDADTFVNRIITRALIQSMLNIAGVSGKPCIKFKD
jgi:hypothetical protein